MKNFTVALFFDLIFTMFSVFLISLVIINYFYYPPFTVIISSALSVLSGLCFLKIGLSKRKKTQLKKSEEKLKENVLLSLNLLPEDSVLDLFFNALKKKGEKFKRVDNGFFLWEKKTFLMVKCSIDGLTKTDIVKAFNQIRQNDKAVIYSTTASKSVKDFASRFNKKIVIYDGEDTFLFLKNNDSLPSTQKALKPKKNKIPIIKTLFTKKNARNFFLFGASFLILSFFIHYKLYYVIMGTLFLLFSLTCRFYGSSYKE